MYFEDGLSFLNSSPDSPTCPSTQPAPLSSSPPPQPPNQLLFINFTACILIFFLFKETNNSILAVTLLSKLRILSKIQKYLTKGLNYFNLFLN